jgi:Na+-driven multidrug efflux pump
MVSQAASRKEYVQCEWILRVAILVLILLYIPFGIIMYKIDFIMGPAMFNADSGSLNFAISYTRTVMIGFFFESLYDIEKKYLL